MVFSTKYSYLALRIGLAIVFFWFGVDKFIHPGYWLDAWVPVWAVGFVGKFGISAHQFIFLNGIFEVLIGLSLVTHVFTKIFSLLGALFLIAIVIFVGISEVTIRDAGLIGGLFAILLWPEYGNGKR